MITNQQLWKQNVDEADVKRIGSILRSKRQEKRLTLESIHAKTYLSLKYLNGLEEGNLDPFPAEVYYTSSLRHYSTYLGLEAAPLTELYRTKQVRVQKEQPEIQVTKKSKSIKVYFIIVLLAGLVVFGLLLRENAMQPQQVALTAVVPSNSVAVSTEVVVAPPQVSTRPVAAASVPAVQPAVAPRPVAVPAVPVNSAAPAATPAADKRLRLSVKITETSWVKILADNEVLFEGTLLEGSEKAWSARERFYLVVGYAPGVQAMLNGKKIDVMKGARQDINQLLLTGDDAKTEG